MKIIKMNLTTYTNNQKPDLLIILILKMSSYKSPKNHSSK